MAAATISVSNTQGETSYDVLYDWLVDDGRGNLSYTFTENVDLIGDARIDAGTTLTFQNINGNRALGSQSVDLTFNVFAGFSNSAFTVDVADSAVTVSGPQYQGKASAGITLSDFGFDGNVNFSPTGGQAYSALIDSGLFTGLFTSSPAFTMPNGGVQTYTENFGYAAIVGTPSVLDARWDFTLSALDAATGTSTFTVEAIPAPTSAALLGLGGLVAARRRRG